MAGPETRLWNLTIELVDESAELSPSLSFYTSDYNRAVNKSKYLFQTLRQQLEGTQACHQELDKKIRDNCVCSDRETVELVRRYDNLKLRLKIKEQIGLYLISRLEEKLQKERLLLLQLAEQERNLKQMSK